MDRRNFLIKSGVTAAGSLFVPAFLKALPVLSEEAGGLKKLIVIQLSGGNDGLNTVIPFRQDPYFKLRPKLALNESERIRLTDDIAVNSALEPLQKYYDNGEWAIVNGVGYPDPNRSHFRSMDIWQSASDSQEFLSTGWLGRFMDQKGIQAGHEILEIDGQLSLANRGAEFKAISMTNPNMLYQATHSGWMEEVVQIGQESGHHHHHNLGYLYQMLIDTRESADYLKEKYVSSEKFKDFPGNAFGNKLKMIAELINARVDTSVYYTSLGGFDTHVNQKPGHARLLKTWAEGIAALIESLKRSGEFENTLIFTFSEFGRRVSQNASNGTDHGTANNVHLMSGALKRAGSVNGLSDLSKLDQEDLIYQLDFRAVYSEILRGWFGVDDKLVLGRNFGADLGLF